MTYVKQGQELAVSDHFLYSEEIYLLYPKRWELYRTKIYSSKVPLNKKNAKAYNEDHGCYVQRYWELVAAPKEYLINEGFKQKL